MAVHVVLTRFKGKRVIKIQRNEKAQYGWTFGLRKAQLAVEHGKKKIEAFIQGEVLDDPLVVVGDFEGHPTIQLLQNAGDKYGFTFGMVKAKQLLEAWDHVESFVELGIEEEERNGQP